jgi:hypothetical protein
MVPRRNQGPPVAVDTWLAAWHTLVSRFLVMIHYETIVDVLFSRVPFLDYLSKSYRKIHILDQK